jgi:hypothetical protein
MFTEMVLEQRRRTKHVYHLEAREMTELERHLMIERYLVERGMSRSKLARKVGCDRSWITLVLKHGARPSKRLRDSLLAQGVPEVLLAPAKPEGGERAE